MASLKDQNNQSAEGAIIGNAHTATPIQEPTPQPDPAPVTDPEAAYTASGSTETQTSRDPKDTTYKCSINDRQTPILILFGPSQCGKSMTMVRLVRFLRSLGYTVEPRRDFRPADDNIYELRCQEFNNTIDTYRPLPGTDWQDYMLATVSDNRGNSVLQILEAPGEAYFSLTEKDPVSKPFPAYLNTIKNSQVPKIWCFFIEPDWKAGKNAQYVQRIQRARKSFIDERKNKFIILYNKIDKKPTLLSNSGKPNMKALLKFANGQYPGLFSTFQNTRLIEKIWRPYLCEFVPFSTGDYSDGDFTESHDQYPAALLSKIKIR